MGSLFKRKRTTPVVLQNVKVTLEEDVLSQQQESPYRFNLFNEDAINNNLLIYGNSNGSSSKFFKKLIQQEHKQYPNLTSIVFTTSLEYYQELIDCSNISTGTYSLSDFTLNPFDTFGELVKDNAKFSNQAYFQAGFQVESLIRDVIKDTGYEKKWTQQHSCILSYQIQELIRNADKTPTMLELYTNIYNEFLEKGKCLTETFKIIQTLEALDSEIIEALDPFTKERNEVLLHFDTLNIYQTFQDILFVLSKFIRIDSYSEYFRSETKMPIMNDKNVAIIEVPKNYGKSDLAAITLLTEFLTQSNESSAGLVAIYHDLQGTNLSSLLLHSLRRCRRYRAGIRVNIIYKSDRDFVSNFSKHAVVQSDHHSKNCLIDQFYISEEECDNILSLKDGESYVMFENVLLNDNWNGKKLIEDASQTHN